MNYIQTEIDGVWLIEPNVYSDERGYFMEAFKKEEFEAKIGPVDFVPVSYTHLSFKKRVETPMVRTLKTIKKPRKVIVLNTKMVTKVGRLPKRLRNHTSVQTPFLTVCILK